VKKWLRSCRRLATLSAGNDGARKDFIACKPVYGTEEADHLCCFAVWLGNYFPTF
jgi:hypothetical protein